MWQRAYESYEKQTQTVETFESSNVAWRPLGLNLNLKIQTLLKISKMEHWNVEACAVKLGRSALEVWKMNVLLRRKEENWSFRRFLTWKIHAGSVKNKGLKCGNWTLKVWTNALFNVKNRSWKCGKWSLEMRKIDPLSVEKYAFKRGKSALEVWTNMRF